MVSFCEVHAYSLLSPLHFLSVQVMNKVSCCWSPMPVEPLLLNNQLSLGFLCNVCSNRIIYSRLRDHYVIHVVTYLKIALLAVFATTWRTTERSLDLPLLHKYMCVNLACTCCEIYFKLVTTEVDFLQCFIYECTWGVQNFE